MNFNDPIFEIIRRIETLEAEQRRLASITPLYSIWNQAEQVSLTADQTNMELDDYGIISRTPTANRIIRGITNGYRGRLLFFRNDSGTFTITFTIQDAAAVAENRIVTASGANVILGIRQTAIFYYAVYTAALLDRWFLVYPIA